MPATRCMEPDDYRTPGASGSDGGQRQLLDWESGEPRREALESRDAALAKIATVIHTNARHLSTTECEQVVRWMKRWKLAQLPPRRLNDSHGVEFEKVLDGLRNSQEQRSLMWRANRFSLAANGWNIFSFILGLCGMASLFQHGIRWYWPAGMLMAALVAYFIGSRREVAAGKAWKEQDRQYAMASIRASDTVHELSRAGLFAFLQGTEFGNSKTWDEAASAKALRVERERLTDALYRDPIDWLTD